MKLVFVCVSAFLILCEGRAPRTTTSRPTTTTTTRYPTTTAGGPGVNLKGKMFTLSRNARVTMFSPNYFHDPSTTTAAPKPRTKSTRAPSTTTTPTTKSTTTTTPPTTTTTTTTTKSTTTRITTTTTSTAMTHTTRRTTTWPTTTTAPVTRGLSVCLRYVADRDSIDFFILAPDSPHSITFTMANQWYTLSNKVHHVSDRRVHVSLKPTIPLWSSVRTQPWTSLCVVLDSLKRVVQVFQTGSMSIRKILPSEMVWSGEPVLDVPGFAGQMTDLEVWDYPLKYEEIFSYMKNYGSRGTVLTWSNIAYRSRGDVLVEDAYDLQTRQTISSRGGRGHGRDRQSGHKSMFSGWRQGKILI